MKNLRYNPLVFALLQMALSISYPVFSQVQHPAVKGDSLSWRREFDGLDRLTKLIDPAGRQTVITYSNDSSGKTVVTKSNSEGVVQQEFDSNNLLTSMKDGLGTVTYQYDKLGNVIKVQREGDPAIQYQYDVEGRIISQSVGDFYKIEYSYDFLGRLSAINTPAGTITYEYQTGQGMVIRKLPNGVQTIWEFGANGQLYNTKHLDPNNYLLAEYSYQYRPDGLIELMKEQTQKGTKVIKNEYDNVGRLIRVADQVGGAYTFSYDLLGNRLKSTAPGGISQTGEYDWAGRLVRFNGKPCSHDVAGNLKTIVLNDTKMNYRYNHYGQLINVNEKVLYRYDGDGKLVERQVNAEITRFISDPFSDYWQPLVMENKTEGKTLLMWDRNSPLVIIKNGKTEYILTDHLGSARLIVDENGKVKQYIDYEPFGRFRNNDGLNGLIVGFTGLFYDNLTKQYLTKARAYCPILGQFMQIEPQRQIPSGSQKEVALYAYCGNDPANFVDRDGAWPKFVWGEEN